MSVALHEAELKIGCARCEPQMDSQTGCLSRIRHDASSTLRGLEVALGETALLLRARGCFRQLLNFMIKYARKYARSLIRGYFLQERQSLLSLRRK